MTCRAPVLLLSRVHLPIHSPSSLREISSTASKLSSQSSFSGSFSTTSRSAGRNFSSSRFSKSPLRSSSSRYSSTSTTASSPSTRSAYNPAFFTSRIFPRTPRTARVGLRLCLGAGLGLAAGSPAIQGLRPQVQYCDNGFEAFEANAGLKTTREMRKQDDGQKWSYEKGAKAPVVGENTNKGVLIRQLSAGSVLGLLCGVAVSTFSKTLALLFGLGVVIVQAAASRGIHLIPYKRLQRYVQRVDIRAALYDNILFKLSFGATFALAAFADFS